MWGWIREVDEKQELRKTKDQEAPGDFTVYFPQWASHPLSILSPLTLDAITTASEATDLSKH